MHSAKLSKAQAAAAAGRLKVSFEFFPPKNETMETALAATIKKLAPLNPDFVSVTYGAGGSTRQPTADTLKKVIAPGNVDAAAHLTCVGATKAQTNAVIAEFASLGVRRFVALRGDPQTGVGTGYVPHPDGYENAADLVAGLRAQGDFDISVAAYPEKHPESATFDFDMDMLKRKIDNGADRAITQFFFDNDTYERFVDRARKAGISAPIVPGILPIHSFKAVSSFAGRCGAVIPQWLSERFDGLEDDPQTHALLASAIAAEQVLDLADRGVQDFHFYTMNRADLVFAICRLIGIQSHEANDIAA